MWVGGLRRVAQPFARIPDLGCHILLAVCWREGGQSRGLVSRVPYPSFVFVCSGGALLFNGVFERGVCWRALPRSLRALLRCVTAAGSGNGFRSFHQQPQGAVYRFGIRRHASQFRFDEDEVCPRDSLPVALAANHRAQLRKVALRAKVVSCFGCRFLLLFRIGCALGDGIQTFAGHQVQQLQRWALWALFAALPLADQPGRYIQITREYRLARPFAQTLLDLSSPPCHPFRELGLPSFADLHLPLTQCSVWRLSWKHRIEYPVPLNCG